MRHRDMKQLPTNHMISQKATFPLASDVAGAKLYQASGSGCSRRTAKFHPYVVYIIYYLTVLETRQEEHAG